MDCRILATETLDGIEAKSGQTQPIHLCAFVENSAEAVFLLAADGLVQYGNSSVRNRLGWKQERLADTPFTDLVHPDDVARVKSLIERCGNTSTFADQTVQIRLRAHQDTWRTFQARFCTVELEGFGTGIAVNALDITTQREMEAELQTALRNSALAELVGSAAHDFNNYLMVIANSAAMAESLVDAEGDAAFEISEIRKAAKHAHKLARKLLAKSRESQGTFTAVDLNRLLIDSGGMLRRIATRPGSEIKVLIDVNPEAVICRGARDSLQQCLINLVSNAHDAIEDSGTISLFAENRVLKENTIMTGSVLPKGRYGVIHVKDTGKGMTQDVGKKIFNRFFSTKPDTHGTGIGLATVKEILELHDGGVEVETAPGKGTEFRLFIPSAL